MTEARRLLIAQSGGATAVINASLVGAIHAAQRCGTFAGVVGARHGIEGILAGNFVDLGHQPVEVLERLKVTPSAALGTTRQRLDEESARRAVGILASRRIGSVAYIGGNDSADTAMWLAAAARERGYDLAVVSVPKTIDNDLPGTDHCPGYPSIARFIAHAVRDAGRDSEATASLYPVKLIEVMGRDAGWVAAAAALGQERPGDAPQLIFFPERAPSSLVAFLTEIRVIYDTAGFVVAVVPETLTDASGRPLTGQDLSWTDPFGHRYYQGPGPALTRAIEEHLGLRARFDKPGTIARMFTACGSEVDLREAYEVGAAAVRLLAEGVSEVMVTIERLSDDPYRSTTGSVSLREVANHERRLPDHFIGSDGRSVTEAFRRYALPLIGGALPPYGRLLDLPLDEG